MTSKEFQDSLIPDKINFTEYQSTSTMKHLRFKINLNIYKFFYN